MQILHQKRKTSECELLRQNLVVSTEILEIKLNVLSIQWTANNPHFVQNTKQDQSL